MTFLAMAGVECMWPERQSEIERHPVFAAGFTALLSVACWGRSETSYFEGSQILWDMQAAIDQPLRILASGFIPASTPSEEAYLYIYVVALITVSFSRSRLSSWEIVSLRPGIGLYVFSQKLSIRSFIYPRHIPSLHKFRTL